MPTDDGLHSPVVRAPSSGSESRRVGGSRDLRPALVRNNEYYALSFNNWDQGLPSTERAPRSPAWTLASTSTTSRLELDSMRASRLLRSVRGRIALASLAASGLALTVEAVGAQGVGAATFQRLMVEHGASAELAHAMFDESVTRVGESPAHRWLVDSFAAMC